MTTLSIVIVSFNAREDLERCLASLARVAAGRRARDHRRRQCLDRRQRRPARGQAGVRVIDAGANVGFARANNLGIRASHGELVLLLNSDTIVPPGAIDACSRSSTATPASRLSDRGSWTARVAPSCRSVR